MPLYILLLVLSAPKVHFPLFIYSAALPAPGSTWCQNSEIGSGNLEENKGERCLILPEVLEKPFEGGSICYYWLDSLGPSNVDGKGGVIC